jgi:hypothetical protein
LQQLAKLVIKFLDDKIYLSGIKPEVIFLERRNPENIEKLYLRFVDVGCAFT